MKIKLSLFVFAYTACLVELAGVISNSREESYLKSNNNRQEKINKETTSPNQNTNETIRKTG